MITRGYTPPPVPSEFPGITAMRSVCVCVCVPTTYVYVCMLYVCFVAFSDEELQKFLDETEGPVLVENFVRNLDAVSHMTVTS